MVLRIFSILMILVVMSTGTAFASTSLISVQTDDDNYDEGDTIVISGEVATIIGNTQITLQLFKQGNMVEIAQISIYRWKLFTYNYCRRQFMEKSRRIHCQSNIW